jgi:hypothetical protein
MNRQIVFASRVGRIEFAIRLYLRTLLILVPILSATIPTSGQEGYRYKVKGRVVDENRQPVAHAVVVVDAGLPTSWEDFTYSMEADQSGTFLFFEPEATTDPDLTRFLYVTGPVPKKAYNIIRPPFNRLPQLVGPSFASRRIVIKKNQDIDVGDVPIQVRYGVVRIRLQDRRSQPLIKSAEPWRVVWFRIRNHQGAVIAFGSLSINDIEKSVNLRESSVDVSLPEGFWFIDASPNEDKGPWLTSPSPVDVKASYEANLALTLP